MIATELDSIMDRYSGASRDALIPLLQDVQSQLGFLSREAVVRVGKHLQLPPSKIYGVATFYNQFRFQPQGKYHIQICRGTACHVRGSCSVLDSLRRELKINPGQTTHDGLFSLEVVACIGACGLAPVICVNDQFHANVSTRKIGNIINDYRKRAEQNDDNKAA